jgi:hypothetical protein
MNSWVYIFSKFTSEALLLELLIIFLLCCGYTAFWVLRKRRYGAVDSDVPSGPVKTYLNELIGNAEQIRLQLFGLLSGMDTSSSSHLYRLVGLPGSPNADAIAADPEIAKKLTALETKLMEQLKAMESLASDKARLERDLTEAKAGAGSVGSSESNASTGSQGDAGTDVKLQQKIQDLENRLAEYNVIEDDLANLKRLQQENSLLKSTLNSKGIAIPTPGSNPSAAAAAPAPTQTAAAPVATPPAASAPPSAPPTEPASTPPASSNNADAIAEDVFANLSTQVEQSLQGTSVPEASAPAEAAASPGNERSQNENEKSEADLVAEFEKMLKG